MTNETSEATVQIRTYAFCDSGDSTISLLESPSDMLSAARGNRIVKMTGSYSQEGAEQQKGRQREQDHCGIVIDVLDPRQLTQHRQGS